MPWEKGQSGNPSGRKRSKPLTDALRRELTQKPEDVLAIALRLIEDAKAGDSAARSLIFDRVDGKVPQPVVGDDEHDPIRTDNPLTAVYDAIRAAAEAATSRNDAG